MSRIMLVLRGNALGNNPQKQKIFNLFYNNFLSNLSNISSIALFLNSLPLSVCKMLI